MSDEVQDKAGDNQGANGDPVRKPSSETSATNLDPNLAALLAYVFGWVSGLIIFLIEPDNKYVRFHALQSIFFNVAIVIAMIGLSIVFGILGAIPGLGILFLILLPLIWGIGSLGIFALWIVLMIKAYQGEKFKLPVIGDIAEQNA